MADILTSFEDSVKLLVLTFSLKYYDVGQDEFLDGSHSFFVNDDCTNIFYICDHYWSLGDIYDATRFNIKPSLLYDYQDYISDLTIEATEKVNFKTFCKLDGNLSLLK